MPGIFLEAVEQYIYSLLPTRCEVLSEMEALAHERQIPIVGPAVGMLLAQLAAISGARRVFEMGSAIGYSTIWLARAVGDGGKVIYTDGDTSNAEKAKSYFTRADVSNRIECMVGDALELLEGEGGPFDIIFNDVDKQDYPRVIDLAAPRLKQGGLFITDNTLWSGRAAVLAANASAKVERDESTRAIVEFNHMLHTDDRFFTTLIPLRDGVTVARKL